MKNWLLFYFLLLDAFILRMLLLFQCSIGIGPNILLLVLAPNVFFSFFWCTYYVIISIFADVASGVAIVIVAITVVVVVSADVNDVVTAIDASVVASRVDGATFYC